MAIVFREYRQEHVPAVEQFNHRIAGSIDTELLFPVNPVAQWLPKGKHPAIFQESVVASDGAFVRGGYFLKHQDFALRGAIRRVSTYRLPLSEGIANRAFASLALQMLRNALRRQPFLFSLGIGGLDLPLARLQKVAGWSQYIVPLGFKVLHGGQFVRNIQALRTTALKRLALDLAGSTGIAALLCAAIRAVRPTRIPSGVSAEPFHEFGPWTDKLWGRCQEQYSLIAVRDQDAAAALYPAADARFMKWKIAAGGKPIGWVVCLNTSMRAHKHFGDLRVATIVDCLAEPQHAGAVIAVATRELQDLGADLIISNQMHEAWAAALTAAGFLSGPSNYIFSASPELSKALAPFGTGVRQGHITRGDGDGPIHL